MASLSNRKIEEHNAGTQSESSSERSNVESSDEFENYPGRSQKLDTKLAWDLMTFHDMCNVYVKFACLPCKAVESMKRPAGIQA